MSNKIRRTGIQNLDAWTEGGKHYHEQSSRDGFRDHPGPKHLL